jgi:carboxypeptidase family protein/TonB-dependent receptor-like protein
MNSLETHTCSQLAAVTRHSARILAAGIGALLLSLPLYSQSYTGRILGSVHDKSDAVIVGANVGITDVERNLTRSLLTDQAGEFVAPDLLPGMYKVRAEAKGFKTYERQNIQIEVASDVRVDILLQPGDAAETVVVTEQVPLLNTTSATLGGTLSNEEINDLPLNGRNYENLLQLRPGVVRYPGGGFSTTSTNGLRAEDNAYIIDGIFNSEPFSGQSIINGAGIAGDSATILPIDSIQEFNVQENPPAEYGWKPGAIVNVAVKSGTNSLHGSAYGFYRDTIFDARNFFNTLGSPKTPRSLKQFGTSVGGPIIKDKLFFFGAYEGQRYKVGNSFVEGQPNTVPFPNNPASNCTFISVGDCANSIPDAIADVHAAFLAGMSPDVSPVSLQVAGCQFTPPTATTCNGRGFPLNNQTAAPGLVTIGFPNVVNADNAVGKVDYRINDRHTISGRYFFGNNSGTVDDAQEVQPAWLTLIHTRAQVFGVNWAYVPSSHWVNEARFGYNRLYQPTFTADHSVPASSYGLHTGVTNPLFGGLPLITLPQFIAPNTLGGFVWPKIQGPDTRFQFVDHVSYIWGKHAFKFGGEIHRDSFTGAAFARGRGQVKFLGGQAFTSGTSTQLEDFFAGAPAKTQVLIGDANRQIHNWSYAGFFQDDWRITPRVTLNLGLRYEFSTVVKDDQDRMTNFFPNVGVLQVGHGISRPYQSNGRNFAPRLGVAWDPTGSGKTVVRAGGGITYELINWEAFLAFNNTLGIANNPTALSTGVPPGTGTLTSGVINAAYFANPAAGIAAWNTGPLFSGSLTCSSTFPCTIFGINPDLVTPRVFYWNFNVQHAFTNTLSLEVGYVGNHGSKLSNVRDINQPVPGLCKPGDAGCEQANRPNFPNALGAIYQLSNLYKSNYNALQATLTARNFHRLTFLAGYTYAHALDDVGANWDFGAGLGLPQDSMHPQREYASSDFDIRHRFTLAVNYKIPGRESFAQLLEGWELNSIVTLNTAQPWGPMDTSTDVSGTGESAAAATGIERWDFFGNSSDFKSGPTPIPFFPGASNAACAAKALALDSGVAGGPASQSLASFGCYAKRSSIMIPPPLGRFGTMGRNLFRDSGFRNWDFSVAKNWKIRERFGVQFRAEFFNILNHPNFANPFGGQNGYAHNDPSSSSTFGCGCATPDSAASNPVIGSGGSRALQFGLKLLF